MIAADDALDVPPSASDAQWRNIALPLKWARDLPDFFERLISGEMALHRKGRADEKEPIQR